MRYRLNAFRLFVLCGAALMLFGCESVNTTVKDTVGSVKQNLSNISMPDFGFMQKDDAENSETVMIQQKAVDCPPVIAVDDLRFLHQYMDGNDVKPVNKISSIVITRTDSRCHIKNGTLVVDLTIEFNGTLGPEAETWKTRRVSFAYPYFLAIGTPDDNIMAKEIFPLTLSYGPDEKDIFHRENIRQVIPFSGQYDAKAYNIMLGFQLTENELRYNQTLLRRKTGKKPIITEEKGENKAGPNVSRRVLEAPPLPMSKPPYEIKDPVDTEKVKAAPAMPVQAQDIMTQSEAEPEKDIESMPAAETMENNRESAPSAPPQTAGDNEAPAEQDNTVKDDPDVTYMAPSRPVETRDDVIEGTITEKDATAVDTGTGDVTARQRPDAPATDSGDGDIPALYFYEYPEDESPRPPEMPAMTE